MRDKDKKIEELTSGRLKNFLPDEPSADFTLKVMQSVLSENRTVYALRPRKYFWLTGLVSGVIIISWYFLNLFQLTGYLDRLGISAVNFIKPFLNTFLTFSIQLKNLNIQPLY